MTGARIRLSDLRGKARDQALAALDRKPSTPRPKRATTEQGLPLTCLTCGTVIDHPSESAIERHGCSGRYEHQGEPNR